MVPDCCLLGRRKRGWGRFLVDANIQVFSPCCKLAICHLHPISSCYCIPALARFGNSAIGSSIKMRKTDSETKLHGEASWRSRIWLLFPIINKPSSSTNAKVLCNPLAHLWSITGSPSFQTVSKTFGSSNQLAKKSCWYLNASSKSLKRWLPGVQCIFTACNMFVLETGCLLILRTILVKRFTQL